LCFSWGSWEHTCLVLGAVRSLGSQLLVSRGVLRLVPRKFNFLWVVDFPLLERRDDGVGRWKAVHHPFTAPHPDDLPALLTALDSGEQDEPLLALRAQAYDLVCNGVEVGGGSIRVHQEWLQQKLFRFLDIDPSLFEHLLGALRWGCPPHGGFALGLDRLVAILASETAYPLKIKDVIAFPKSGNGADLTVGAPAKVTDASLASFGLQLTQLEPLSSSSTSSLTSSNL
jgi:aspartyl-tRNA synthetase